MTQYLLYLYAESPVHAGASDSAGVIDLPVQREASTGYPVIWGQSLKGALRQAAADASWDPPLVTAVFGSAVGEAGEDGGTTAGMLNVGDAQLVAMPVPTLMRTFAWVTSEIALGRLSRKYIGLPKAAVPELPGPAPDRALAGKEWVDAAGTVLGPLVVSVEADDLVVAWAAQLAADAIVSDNKAFTPFTRKIRKDLLVVGEDITPTLLQECTEQTVRIQLTENKTVNAGPFYSEYLPTETILAASLTLRGTADTPSTREALRKLLNGTLLQLGGDETLGKGLVWTRLHGSRK